MCDNIKGKTETTQYIRCRNKYQVRFLLIHLLQRNTFISIHEVEVYGKPEGKQFSFLSAIKGVLIIIVLQEIVTVSI